MNAGTVSLDDVLSTIGDLWSPHRVATVNDYDVKVVKLAGEFVEHTHADTDEFFLVLEGELVIELPDDPAGAVVLRRHDVFVVPKGARHRPRAAAPTRVLLFEPAGVINTGDAGGPMTREALDLR